MNQVVNQKQFSCFLCPHPPHRPRPPPKKPCWLNGSFSDYITNHSLGRTPQDTPEQLTSSTPASKLSCEHFSLHLTLEKQELGRGPEVPLSPLPLHCLPHPAPLPPPPTHTHTVTLLNTWPRTSPLVEGPRLHSLTR